MKIKTIIFQNRRDFTAIYECEHCGHESTHNGYDNSFFHESVLPQMKCASCGKEAPDTYRPLSTKYPDNKIV